MPPASARLVDRRGARWRARCSSFVDGSHGQFVVIGDVRAIGVAPVAGIPIVHELLDGIELERRDMTQWTGTAALGAALVIRHELGDAAPAGMHSVLDVPPWCTFHVDRAGEPASLFHG